MITSNRIFLSVLFLALVSLPSLPASAATQTNVWPFTTPSQYVVSNPNKIQVADGVAKLVLQATSINHASLTDYETNTTQQSGVGLGPDANTAMVLTGSQYGVTGQFESRVLDGGSGNVWQNMQIGVSDKGAMPAATEYSPLMSNVVALYHFNNTLRDEVSATLGSNLGGSYSPYVRVGAGSFSCWPGYCQTVNSSLLNGRYIYTIMSWVRLRNGFVPYGGIVSANGVGLNGIGMSSGPNFRCDLHTTSGAQNVVSPTVLSLGQWYHVALTRSMDGRLRFYLNGVLDATGAAQSPMSPVLQDDYFKVGIDDFSSARTTPCAVDELVIFDRDLSAEEVANAYLRCAPVGIRLRSGSTSSLSSTYTGPDGTPYSYYAKPYEVLSGSGSFNPSDRYVQYQATFISDGLLSPGLDAVRLVGNSGTVMDDTYADFAQGMFVAKTAVMPGDSGAQYLRVAKSENGAFSVAGTFTSRVLDAGAAVTWNQLGWAFGGTELPNNISGLQGLWHMNETWNDVSGKGHLVTPNGGVAFTSLAKLGSRSVSFNGVDASLYIGNMGTNISSVEWWMETPRVDCGIMELLPGQAWVVLSNGMIRLMGNSLAGATVYVDGDKQAVLRPGWNHVVVNIPVSGVSTTAVVYTSGISNTDVTVGYANGGFYEGNFDELALYSRVLSAAEIKGHYGVARRSVAGQIQFQARADNNNPPQTPFVGQSDTTASYFIDPAGAVLPNSFVGKRYFQYRAYLAGDGNASPALNSVLVQYAGSSIATDNTRDLFRQGSFDAGSTVWAGDTVGRESLRGVGPSATSLLSSPQLMTLWHMDDTVWQDSSPTVRDSSGNGRNGTPVGSVTINHGSRVESGAALFLTNGYITASGGVMGTDDFTVSLWWSSTMTGTCALVTTYAVAATPFYALELNPTNALSGSVAFVLSDGVTVYRATSFRPLWNDGNWHQVSAMKKGSRIYLYMDGVMEGAAQLASGSINMGAGSVSLGKYGSRNVFFTGMMDEVMIHSRALEEWEIAELAAAGYNTRGFGTFAGPVMDGGQATYWERINWTADAPYGREHVADPGSIEGLWHFNVISNGVTSDASGYGHDGTVEGGGTVSASGRLGSCLSLTGAGQRVRIPYAASLDLNTVSWETWVNLTLESSAVLLDRSSGGTGVRMGTDASGRPYWQVGGTVATAVFPLRTAQWYHLAGTFDGSNACLYVNGRLKARKAAATENPVAAVDALIGGGGLFDEAAVYNRPFGAEEVLDHYRAGAVTLGFQARSWITAGLPGDFIGPDGTTNTYFTDPANSLLTSVIPLNQYFQYRAILATEDATLTPTLQGVQVDMSAYPTDNPWVAPATGYGAPFFGNLLSYMHVLGTNNNDSEVKYQISGNNGTNWYYWGGSSWDDVTIFTNSASSWQFSNTKDLITANIGSFYDQLYAKTGGVFKFKAFLKSDAIKQISLDEVRLAYSPGRVVMTVPNGLEIGQESWLEGVPYTVQWNSAGTVGNKVKLEYSLNSGSSWNLIASNVANVAGSNSYSFWTTPPSVSDLCRVRVTDMADPTISDLSDNDFSIVERFRMLVPNGGERWYTGRTNTVRWASALNLGLLRLDYLANGASDSNAAVAANYTYNVAIGLANTPGSSSNVFQWATPTRVPELLSEAGRMSVRTFSGGGFDASDAPFTLAGIEFTNPVLGSSVKRNGSFNIQWIAAGAGAAVAIDFSADSGANWTNVVASAPCVAGSNTYAWVAVAPPTDLAQLRLRSLSDTNVLGVSDVFTLADIDVTSPTAESVWLMGSTNTVTWQAGGAGDKVNIYYSTNSGVSWVTVALNVTNAGGANSYAWRVPPFPGSKTRIKVESVQDPMNLWAASPDFNLAGVRVTVPNGGETWVKGIQNYLGWEFQSIGQLCTVQFSYDGGLSYTNIGGPGIGLTDRSYVYTPTWPTVRAKAKVVADDPSPFTNVFDESDAYFTVAGITVTTPSNGVQFTIGTMNAIEWTSAGSDDPLGYAKIYYTTTLAGTDSNLIATVGNNQAFPGGNTYNWNILPGVTPSATARIIVQSGAYGGRSAPFILRGIKFITPDTNTVYDIGANAGLGWVYAGLDASAVGYLYLSTDGGATFGATPINASQIWPVQGGGYPWVISSDTTPTTNAVIKYKVMFSSKPEDVGFEALSQPFVIRGMKITTPTALSVWDQGQTNTIAWLSSRAGPYVTLTYSANGGAFDLARPIASNRTLSDGTNTFDWLIETFRMPSTNARIRATSALATADSPPFTVRGIRVTTPTSSDVWAVDETNRLAWTAVGTVGLYDISLIRDGSVVIPIASNVVQSYYDWVVTSNTVSTNDVMIVQDSGGLRGVSDTFRIVGEPSVAMVSPVAGDLLKVSQTYTISWSKGGKMENDFHVMFSTFPYLTTNDIFTGVADFNSTNNTFSVPWSVPDRLGSTVILIQHNTRPPVNTVSQPFTVVGMFTMLSPNGGETGIYALKPKTVSWLTRGSVLAVNLYYSYDPLHLTWIPINSTPIANNGGGVADILTTYDWTVAKVDSSTVRLRVEQANEPGAYDDSDADFAINYYSITWHVFDAVTTNNLDKLNVVDSSGWSQADVTSPTVHRYPYGTFNTVWGREYFFNNVTFNWSSEPSRIIDVALLRSSSEPDFTVFANFTYDSTNSQFRATSWLQQKGKTVINPAKCTVSVYDATGVMALQLTSSIPDANGVFWQVLPNSLAKGKVYFAKVAIEFSGATYSSGVTFNLVVPADSDQAQQMMNALTNIQAIASRVDTNLTGLASAQSDFRAATGAKLDSLTNSAEVIKAGLTNLNLKVDLLSTQALAQLSVLTNSIGVIGSGSNVVDMLRTLTSAGASREARILTRPTSVKLGTSLSLLYRSLPLLTASCQVYLIGSSTPSASGTMGGGTGGIYEYSMIASWGVGDYKIVCSDNSGASDQMIIKVTATEIDDIALTMGNISGQLARVEFNMTNLVSMVSDTATNINSLIVDVSNMTFAVGQMSALTNLNSQIGVLTNSIERIAGLTNVSSQLASLTNMPTQLASLTNLPVQMAGVTNMIGQLGSLTNLNSQIGVLTNSIERIAGLTNVSSQLASLTNMPTQLASLTNLPVQMAGVTNTIGQLGSLTNLGPQVDQLVAAMAQIAGMTNLNTKMDSVVSAIGQLGGLTNLGPQVDQLVAAMAQIAGMTNLNTKMDSVVTAIGQLGSLTNLGPQVDALTAALPQLVSLTNMAGQVNYLTTTMSQLSGLTNMPGQLSTLTTSLNSITNLGGKVDQLSVTLGHLLDLTNMVAQLSDVNAQVGQLSGLTNVPTQLSGISTAIGKLGSLTNLGSQVDALNGAMAQIMVLTNMSTQVNDLVTGLTTLSSTSVAMSNTLAQLTVSVQALAGVSNSLSSVSALMPLVSSISSNVNSIRWSDVAALQTGLAGVAALNSNVLNEMEGKLGLAVDPATANTVFGRLAAIEQNVNAVGGATASAVSKASGARSQASSAASGLQKIKKELGSGKVDQMASDLSDVRKALEGALKSVNQVSGSVSTAELAKVLNDAAAQIKKIADDRGFTPMGMPGKVEPGSLTDPKALTDLLNKLSETKAMMEATRLLMDNAINKPVVVDWLEGSK